MVPVFGVFSVWYCGYILCLSVRSVLRLHKLFISVPVPVCSVLPAVF